MSGSDSADQARDAQVAAGASNAPASDESRFTLNGWVTRCNSTQRKHLRKIAGQNGLAVWLELDAFQRDKEFCWPSLATLAKEAGIGRKAVSCAIAELAEANVIEVTKGGPSTPNRYKLLPHAKWKAKNSTKRAQRLLATKERAQRPRVHGTLGRTAPEGSVHGTRGVGCTAPSKKDAGEEGPRKKDAGSKPAARAAKIKLDYKAIPRGLPTYIPARSSDYAQLWKAEEGNDPFSSSALGANHPWVGFGRFWAMWLALRGTAKESGKLRPTGDRSDALRGWTKIPQDRRRGAYRAAERYLNSLLTPEGHSWSPHAKTWLGKFDEGNYDHLTSATPPVEERNGAKGHSVPGATRPPYHQPPAPGTPDLKDPSFKPLNYVARPGGMSPQGTYWIHHLDAPAGTNS